MFSASLEAALTIAYREATSRRHADLTVEHLLYSLAHDSDGERILEACGVDLPSLRHELDTFLNVSVEQFKRNQEREPEQTLAFRRVLQTAVLHVQSAGRQEVQAGDILAAILQQPRTHAAELLLAHGVSRLDILNYISHGVSKVPPAASRGDAPLDPVDAGAGEEGRASARDPLRAYAMNLSERARQGLLDPLIG
ncbi:MAG: Clp protease N-terminal domain-containing protein, partial [Vicinamibacterales bacterium]